MQLNLIETQLINASFSILLITLFLYWSNLIIIKLPVLKNLTLISTATTNIFLALALLLRWMNYRYFPLSNLYESLIFLSWCFTLIQIILEKKNNNKLIGAIIIPMSLFTLAFANLSLPEEMKEAQPLVPALRSNWLMMHVSIMIFSYATLIVGSLLSILFLLLTYNQNINIQGNSYINKSKLFLEYNNNFNNQQNININTNLQYYNRINLLESIDNLSYRIIGLGFPLLTLGIIAGSVWANEAWGSYWSWDPKETWAIITWLIFAIYLHTRLNKSWNGKKPAILASIGFIVVWICYLGVNFLGQGLHSYGWIS
uniref:Cytochrome c biogenesis protein CcsA n=1 Tax=Anotrichium furcellatum TaxID=41999 RepID=A0A4D6WLU6_9FLOR|nr:cytochrome c biogenesis protein ccs1 [Anotrichium furcellatum]